MAYFPVMQLLVLSPAKSKDLIYFFLFVSLIYLNRADYETIQVTFVLFCCWSNEWQKLKASEMKKLEKNPPQL